MRGMLKASIAELREEDGSLKEIYIESNVMFAVALVSVALETKYRGIYACLWSNIFIPCNIFITVYSRNTFPRSSLYKQRNRED